MYYYLMKFHYIDTLIKFKKFGKINQKDHSFEMLDRTVMIGDDRLNGGQFIRLYTDVKENKLPMKTNIGGNLNDLIKEMFE